MVTVQQGNFVILKELLSGASRLVKIEAPGTEPLLFLKKFHLQHKLLIGLPYGCTLGLDEQLNWKRCRYSCINDVAKQIQSCILSYSIDQNKLQSWLPECVNSETIVTLKQEGINVCSLICSICRNSESFLASTSHGQIKYIKRKLRRHALLISILQPTLLNLWESYEQQKRFGGLRLENLGSMLNEANVKPNSKVLVFDHTLGLMSLAVMQRLDATGSCIYISHARGTSRYLVDKSNLSVSQRKTLLDLPYDILLNSLKSNFDADINNEKLNEYFNGSLYDPSNIDDLPDNRRECFEAAKPFRRNRELKRLEIFENCKAQMLDCFLISINSHTYANNDSEQTVLLLNTLFKFAMRVLKPTGRLAIFMASMNPLIDLFAQIKNDKLNWINAKFQEFLVRRICVDKGQSHPQMNKLIQLSGGFVLTASRISQKSIS